MFTFPLVPCPGTCAQLLECMFQGHVCEHWQVHTRAHTHTHIHTHASHAYTNMHTHVRTQVFREVFDLAGWRAACDAAAAGIREEARTFKNLLDHCSEVWLRVTLQCGCRACVSTWACTT